MPNTSVRAAAEGMPNVNRRNLLLGAAAISTVAAVASVAPHAHASPNSLAEVITACQSAENNLIACEAKEAALADALGEGGLYPKWTPPSGLSSIWSHRPKPFGSSAALEAELARKSAQVETSFAGGMMSRGAYIRWTRGLAEEGSEGLAMLREQEARLEASGYPEAYRLTDDAHSAFIAAFDIVARHPCHTLDDVRAKAACLIRGYQRLGAPVDSDDLIACLASFCGEG